MELEEPYLKDVLKTWCLVNHPSKTAFPVGKDDSGNIVVADLDEMPHLLVAGSTGSGKTAFLNSLIVTFLYRVKPSDVGLIIIDTKKIEFNSYAGNSFLMKDIATDSGQAVSCLRWVVNEMTNRYQRLKLNAVRNYRSYNLKIKKGMFSPEEKYPRMMNQIVIIIDELSDLMMTFKDETEALLTRLVQLSRPTGIHLVISTQRPSSDILREQIKANILGRISFYLPAVADYKAVLGSAKFEKLSGIGEMLFLSRGYREPVHLQGVYISDEDIQNAVDFAERNYGNNYYFEKESKEIEEFMNSSKNEHPVNEDLIDDKDEFFYEAGKLCIEMCKASSSMLQRRFNVSFNRAAKIIDQLEEFGVVGPQQGAYPREILLDAKTFEAMFRDTHNM